MERRESSTGKQSRGGCIRFTLVKESAFAVANVSRIKEGRRENRIRNNKNDIVTQRNYGRKRK